MLLSVFFALMVGSDANGGTGQGGASPALVVQCMFQCRVHNLNTKVTTEVSKK